MRGSISSTRSMRAARLSPQLGYWALMQNSVTAAAGERRERGEHTRPRTLESGESSPYFCSCHTHMLESAARSTPRSRQMYCENVDDGLPMKKSPCGWREPVSQ